MWKYKNPKIILTHTSLTHTFTKRIWVQMQISLNWLQESRHIVDIYVWKIKWCNSLSCILSFNLFYVSFGILINDIFIKNISFCLKIIFFLFIFRSSIQLSHVKLMILNIWFTPFSIIWSYLLKLIYTQLIFMRNWRNSGLSLTGPILCFY